MNSHVAHILVIEDSTDSLELMAYLLRAHGYSVSTADNGAIGLDIMRETRPDLVICDIQMPVLDGYEVANQAKQDPNLNQIPIIAVTALAMVGDKNRILAAGFDGYVSKPIEPETFIDAIEPYLPASKRTGQPEIHVQTAALASQIRRELTVLVVDNLIVQLELARSILEPFGYKVLTATSPSQALEILETESIQLILSDINMNESSGFEFLQIAKASTALREIPFILITSTFWNDDARELGLNLGATKFLRRPMEPERLLKEIEDCLS